MRALMPTNWDHDFDATLNLRWALANSQAAGSDLDITIDYTVPQNVEPQTGIGVTRLSSQVAGKLIVVAGKRQPGDTYTMPIVFNRNDPSNPTTPSDASGFALEIGLANLVGVREAHFLGGCIIYRRQN